MSIESPQENKKNSKKLRKVFRVDKYVCKYLAEEWFSSGESMREYGKVYGVNYHVIEKIIGEDGYNIPLHTLNVICFNKGIKLSDFFKLVERKYGGKLDDHYELK
ncbi:hypothetical protein [Imtechella halotolerans]|uniref:HTH cro/C1-type domain-containing protein n=1 Tax=Imtechella halotolerans K1 TaxID=946077 RepID=I0W8P1_9FLAO|nr:hypothetical protein [Imtechella halotolerans]EID72757.1 hypothetical protein W5A_11159 [Imtechella halotolerans K1]WMQ62095.1 hypothetical protein PT603_07005 [Imtechella halotolerans]